MTDKKVTSMAKEAQRSSEAKKPDRYDINYSVAEAMCGNLIGGSLDAGDQGFPMNLKVIVDPQGNARPVEIQKNGVVRDISLEGLKRPITQYCHQNFIKCDDTHAASISKMWLSMADAIKEEEIGMVGLRDSHQTTRHRLEFDLQCTPTPIFDEFIGRVKGKKELMAFIGSLLDDNSDRSQYVWVYGDGANGKSSLLAFLKETLGYVYKNAYVPSQQRQHFFNATIYDKRLVAFPDCNSPSFPVSGYFKSLTGDKMQEIEKKGEKPFETAINAKFIFMSNMKPNISSSESDMRRVLFCQVDPLPEGTELVSQDEYVALMVKEAPGIYYKCLEEYKKNKNGFITRSQEVDDLAEDLIFENEEEFERVFYKGFEIGGPEDQIKASQASQVYHDNGMRNKKVQGEMKRWLQKRRDVKIFRNNKGIFYQGIRLKGGSDDF